MDSDREPKIGGITPRGTMYQLHENVNQHTIAQKLKAFQNANVI